MKRSQIIILASFAGGMAILCFLSWQFLFQAIRRDINDQQAQLEAAIKELDEAKSKAAQHEKFLAEAENVRRGVNFISSRLDPRFSQPEISQVFDKIGLEENVTSWVIKSDNRIVPSKEFPGLNEAEVKITFVSDYHTVGRFINRAIGQKRIVNLTEIRLDSNDPTGKHGVLKADLTFKIYLKTPAPDAEK